MSFLQPGSRTPDTSHGADQETRLLSSSAPTYFPSLRTSSVNRNTPPHLSQRLSPNSSTPPHLSQHHLIQYQEDYHTLLQPTPSFCARRPSGLSTVSRESIPGAKALFYDIKRCSSVVSGGETPISENIEPDISQVYIDQAENVPVKGNSATVIFSLWSTMVGATLLAMPSAFRAAGLYPSCVSVVIMGTLAAYSANVFSQISPYYETTISSLALLPRPLRYFGLLGSVVTLLGAMMLYQMYITDGIIRLIHLLGKKDLSQYRTVFAGGISFIQFFVGFLRSLGPLFKAVAYVVVVVIFLVIFIIIKSIQMFVSSSSGCPSDQYHPDENFGMGWVSIVPVIELMSMLGLSFKVHNVMIEMARQATIPEKVPRDVVLAYICAAAAYGVPSALACVAWRHCGTFKGDFIELFNDPFSDVARFAIMIQVGVVYPLAVYCLRNQALHPFFGDNPYPMWLHASVNLFFCAVAALPAAFDTEPRFVAAAVGIAGVLWITLLPACLKVKHHMRESLPISKPVWVWVILVSIFGCVMMTVTILSLAGVIPSYTSG